MADDLTLTATTREQQYLEIIPQIEGLIYGETDLVANLANVCAALKEALGFFWVGFYLVKDDELVLGPFQGPVACTRIRKGKGVCGTAWDEAKVLVVDDVDQFPGHIACSSSSKSEIVLPVVRNNKVVAILDIDSDTLSDFSALDQTYLEKVVELIQF